MIHNIHIGLGIAIAIATFLIVFGYVFAKVIA